MLKQLSIKNYAIIDALEIAFDPNLNIITGETGAGKSIIVGALNMILGKRADSGVLRKSDSKAIVEGVFDIEGYHLEDLFSKLDLDYDAETFIRREIRPNGKSRAFVNDSPVTLDVLKSLTARLVDLHAQHDTAAVLNNTFYLAVLDRLAGQEKEALQFSADHKEYRIKEKALAEARLRMQNQASDIDYLNFQWNELSELDLGEADGSALEQELGLLQNAGFILENLQASGHQLEDAEVNVVDMISEISLKLSQLAPYSKDLTELSARIESALLEVSDIAADIRHNSESIHLDEERLIELQERQNSINRLLHKHQLQDVEGLIRFGQELKDTLDGLSVSEEDLKEMEKEVAELGKRLYKKALQLSAKRLKKSPHFVRSITDVLKKIGMPHAGVRLEHHALSRSELRHGGIDEFQMKFSANKGVDLQAVRQVASGGERSRLMLAIKSVMAGFLQLPTMIFDEIDTGISGEVAGKVGEILRSMSKNHQVISISHLPQIAAQSSAHFYVYKDHNQKITETRIRKLEEADHIIEVARMLSGDDPGDAAIATARELIGG